MNKIYRKFNPNVMLSSACPEPVEGSKHDSGQWLESCFDPSTGSGQAELSMTPRFVATLSFLFFAFSSNSFSQSIRSTSFDDRSACESSKGVWRQFGNGCVDECRPKLDQFYICTGAITNGCECGKSRCWDGESCTSIESYKKIFVIEQTEEEKILNEAKEKRKEEAKKNQEEIMDKLISKAVIADIAANPNPDPNAPQNSPSNNLGEFFKDKIEAAKAPVSNNKYGIVDVNKPEEKQEELPPTILSTGAELPFDESAIPPFFLQQEKNKQKAGQSSEPKLPEIPLPN
jgi:hypothetical protein